MERIHHPTRAALPLIAALCAATLGALCGAPAQAQRLPGLTAEFSVPLPKTGQFQLCLRDRGRHIGKCDSSPLIREGTLTLAVEYTGGAVPDVVPSVGCDGRAGATVTVGEHPLGSVTATVTGKDPVTREERTTTVGPISVNEGQTIEATACLRTEE